ncbi:hypothetical protein IOC61_15935, partial [Halomonas sp. KAO]|uniref:hypothetical protein n=1 Tax=Halomonas sp. KAO TaxID=2783858 RepID=UPI0018A05AF2
AHEQASDIRIEPTTLTLQVRIAEQAINTLDRMLGLSLARELATDCRQGQALSRQQGFDACREGIEASTVEDGG